MVHVAKQLDLAESPLSIDLVIKSISNLLDGHMLVGLRIQGGAETKLQSLNLLKHKAPILIDCLLSFKD